MHKKLIIKIIETKKAAKGSNKKFTFPIKPLKSINVENDLFENKVIVGWISPKMVASPENKVNIFALNLFLKNT